MNALDLCNCCDVEPVRPGSAAGYCEGCERAARTGSPCWHEEVAS